MAVLMGTTLALPFYFQLIGELSVGETGLVLLVPAVALVIFGMLGSRLCTWFGDRKVALVAAAVSAVIRRILPPLVAAGQPVVDVAGGLLRRGSLHGPVLTTVLQDGHVLLPADLNAAVRAIGMTSGVAIYEASLSAYAPSGVRVSICLEHQTTIWTGSSRRSCSPWHCPSWRSSPYP